MPPYGQLAPSSYSKTYTNKQRGQGVIEIRYTRDFVYSGMSIYQTAGYLCRVDGLLRCI
jgi:hypothetical protein